MRHSICCRRHPHTKNKINIRHQLGDASCHHRLLSYLITRDQLTDARTGCKVSYGVHFSKSQKSLSALVGIDSPNVVHATFNVILETLEIFHDEILQVGIKQLCSQSTNIASW